MFLVNPIRIIKEKGEKKGRSKSHVFLQLELKEIPEKGGAGGAGGPGQKDSYTDVKQP